MVDWNRYEKSPVITGWLRNMIARFGIVVYLWDEKKVTYPSDVITPTGTYNDIYGVFAGTVRIKDDVPGPPPKEIRVLMPPSDWSASDDLFEASIIQMANLYTLDIDMHNGDIVGIKRSDEHILYFKSVQVETIGMEANVITRFRLSSLAGDTVMEPLRY